MQNYIALEMLMPSFFFSFFFLEEQDFNALGYTSVLRELQVFTNWNRHYLQTTGRLQKIDQQTAAFYTESSELSFFSSLSLSVACRSSICVCLILWELYAKIR